MFATVWGLRETRSTISRREILPCRLMTSRTMRRLYGALDCCVVPRLTIDCGGDYIHIQCVNWRGAVRGSCMEGIAAAGTWADDTRVVATWDASDCDPGYAQADPFVSRAGAK